jgi:hypothetical protein
MRIITDFDGPIMDLSDRYYSLPAIRLSAIDPCGVSLGVSKYLCSYAGKGVSCLPAMFGKSPAATSVHQNPDKRGILDI